MIEILQYGLSSNRGGIETYLYKIWKHIDHNIFHFSFIDDTGDGSIPCFYEELKEEGCDFYKITPRRVSVRKNREDVIKLFSEGHFDILHFNVNTMSYMLPVEVALRYDTQVIVHSRSSSMTSKRISRFLHFINRERLKNLNVTRIAVSSMAGEWLFGKSKYGVYNNGIFTSKFRFDEEKRREIRKELKCESNLVIGHVGAFLPVKNHTLLVKAFEVLLKECPFAKLWLVGDGPERAKIEELVERKKIENQVLFLGLRKDMPELYSGMDIFCMPSIFEGFSNALLEAECSGLPCLVSDRIPRDVVIFDDVISLSLDEGIENWGKQLKELGLALSNDRCIRYKEVEKAGFSVRSEIKRLEELYVNVAARKSE